jgi:hypothetical protein
MDSSREELERFFAAPAAYQMALQQRLVDYLCERGKRLLPTKRARALELFNRVLSIDEDNDEVLSYLRRAGRRQRQWKIALGLFAAVLLAVLAVVAKERFAEESLAGSLDAMDAAPAIVMDAEAPVVTAVFDAAAPPVAAPSVDAAPPDAARPIRNGHTPRRKRIDAGVAIPSPAKRSFLLKLSPRGSEYRIGDGPWKTTQGSAVTIQVPAGEQQISARNSSCCQEASKRIAADAKGGPLSMNLQFLPAQITPVCKEANVRVQSSPCRPWSCLAASSPPPATLLRVLPAGGSAGAALSGHAHRRIAGRS